MRPNPQVRIWSHLLKKSLMENFIFCAVHEFNLSQISTINLPLAIKPLFHPVHQNINKDILSNWNTILPEAAMGSIFLKNVFRKSFKLNLKKDFSIGLICEIYEIFKNSYFEEQLQTNASVLWALNCDFS